MNRAFKVIQGHPYWCRNPERCVGQLTRCFSAVAELLGSVDEGLRCVRCEGASQIDKYQLLAT